FKLKAPKPDFYFSFHAYEKNNTDGGPLSADDYIQNFSLTRLSELYEQYQKFVKHGKRLRYGFNPSPCKEFDSLASCKDLTCILLSGFPASGNGGRLIRQHPSLNCRFGVPAGQSGRLQV